MTESDDLHHKSLYQRNADGSAITVWRYKDWGPMTWYFRSDLPNGTFHAGQTFTRWGAKTEATRYLKPEWNAAVRVNEGDPR